MGSPWSYFAYVVLKRYRPIWDFDLVLNPVWLGGVMSASKNVPPFAVPNKFQKMRDEIPLMAKFFAVKCVLPQGPFPFNTLQIMRFLKVVQEKAPDSLEGMTDKLYELVFSKQVRVGGVFEALTPGPLGAAQVAEYVEQSGRQETKEAVRRDVERLVAQGAFGFPWLEIFLPCNHRPHDHPDAPALTLFGSDRFEFLAHWLGKEWKGPNPSAQEPPKSRL